jgi:hypothetical protein
MGYAISTGLLYGQGRLRSKNDVKILILSLRYVRFELRPCRMNQSLGRVQLRVHLHVQGALVCRDHQVNIYFHSSFTKIREKREIAKGKASDELCRIP